MLKLCLSLSLDLKPIHYPNVLQNFFLCHQNMTIDIWIIFSFMYFPLIFVDQNKFFFRFCYFFSYLKKNFVFNKKKLAKMHGFSLFTIKQRSIFRYIIKRPRI